MDNSEKKLSEISDEPLKKTRGRKKKIQPEIEDNPNIDIEQLQIEQVKKKRGRKKKWEVETTTKLIENGPISFSENNYKEEIKQIDDNYEARNILFGNLNIKVHSNKEIVQVDDIKESLKKKGNSICKINLTNSDYEDSDNEEICDNYDMPTDNSNKIKNIKTKIAKLQSSSKKIVEKNMKVMKYFTNEYDSGNEILISPYRCYHCHHNFNNKPFFLPIDYNCELNRFKVTGNFCSPNCVKTYGLNSIIYQSRVYLIAHMYRKLFGPNYTIKPAPPIQTLKEYGGKLSIEEFRENFDNSKQYSVKNIFCKVLMYEVIEK
uniref:Uncharacterized protein n=1 Tax=viral metagenome TaxID=1070528 RepID=A0A6C0LCS4_9ZZZZ